VDPNQVNSTVAEAKEVKLWMNRIKGSEALRDSWEKFYRVAECYQYWRGRQRQNEFDDHGDRKAQHNKIHPDVDEAIASLYFYTPYGKVISAPERADTPAETITAKAQLLQDTGIYLTRDPAAGFRENTSLALKESFWSIGCVEVGYDPDFINNPAAERPPLQEKEDTEGFDDRQDTGGYVGTEEVIPPVDLTAQPPGGMISSGGEAPIGQADIDTVKAQLKELRESLKGETFYVKHIHSKQILISTSDKPVLWHNDWVGYWEEYPLEDVKNSSAYINTENLKASADLVANEDTGAVDRVRLYRIWDLRTKRKLVFAQGHEKCLMKADYDRCPLKFFRPDVDPYHFLPVPPVYLKLPSQDGYNDSAEYMRQMRIGTVPRFTYDEDAVSPDEAAKFGSRDMNVMIPRKGGTHAVIEPVPQPSTSQGAIQTLSLSEKEFVQASSISGDPLSPPTQTATRAVIANTKMQASEGFKRSRVSDWLAEIIEEMILCAVDNLNMPKWIAINVDLDSPLAIPAAQEVAQVYAEINAERLRDAVLGIKWHIEIEPDTLSPVAESERGQKLMQVLNFISNPAAAALMVRAPNLLKRLLSLSGIKNGQDIAAIMEGLMAIVQMNMMQAGPTPGISPVAGQEAGPVPASPQPPGAPSPISPGISAA
jgi:hypothetical protein